MELNREGPNQPAHSITPTPKELTDAQITHERYTKVGRFGIGAGYSELIDELSGQETTDTTVFLQWRSR